MLDRKHLLLLVPSLFASAAVSSAQEKSIEERLSALEKNAGGDTLRVFWKDGVRMESADKRYKFRIGGRLHYDVSFFDQDSDTEAAVETGTTRIEDGAEFRRARINLSGEVGDHVEWTTAYDFAGGGNPNFRDVYVGMSDLFFGSDIRVGQYKEPYGLEQITSSNNLTFLERSLMNTFVPAFNAGVMLFDQVQEERMTWAVGAFRTGTDNGEISKGDGEWATTARVTGLPVWGDEGRSLVHLGLAASHRSPTNDLVSFNAKPEANLAPAYLMLTNLPAETLDLLGGEAAWVHGPLSLQGEYTMVSVDSPSGAGSDPDFSAYYAQASWFITGESRPYRKANGCFDAVKPQSNAFGQEHGHGAWEVAARLSSIDLTDSGVDSGELDDLTFGVNWYLNPNTRVMANYILSDLDPAGAPSEGDTQSILFRVQFAF